MGRKGEKETGNGEGQRKLGKQQGENANLTTSPEDQGSCHL